MRMTRDDNCAVRGIIAFAIISRYMKKEPMHKFNLTSLFQNQKSILFVYLRPLSEECVISFFVVYIRRPNFLL